MSLFSDEDLMVIALSEAEKVPKRAVLPNPRVGAAILTADQKLYFAHHLKAGGPHAEAAAIDLALHQGATLRGATLAVNLEPCAHTGRTPPCADAIVRAGFARVIVGATDPDSRVEGRGIQKLRDCGIEVRVGVLHERCEAVNQEWLHAKRSSLPYVYLKMATSLDGLWTAQSGDSKWITGAKAREHAQILRQSVGVMVTSLRTISTDDPQLNARRPDLTPMAAQPDLMVISRQAQWGEAWDERRYRAQAVADRAVHEWRTGDLRTMLQSLHAQGHTSCLIEAGPKLSSVFLNEDLVQEIWHYQGARYLGGQGKRLDALTLGQLPGLELRVQETHRFDDGDLFIRSILVP